ncbi:hypothetical protein [Dyadobacter sediminis]|uniref:DUF4421 domain-containing protein n=1 Tax=Dyadobacter sediminis TaxID=1493691 RepID=A0A5R9KIK2_9BACT|nr:hypothetical protein [Dyadobacter sediminis]TLU96047.1 hypothetical protein FEM55_02550 [Dyadobacter sediminis]GGB78798.1 hypothetical protein GCM10011325_02930 [Dyadobacter sediminis]
MGKYILFFYLLLGLSAAYSQDSTEVTFSEEPDTLTRQRFIDRYENVFMTKVPTRHIVKLGLSQYYQAVPYPLTDDKTLNNLSLHLGYEFKFLPAFSLALSGHFPLYGVQTPIKESLQNTVMDAQLRWFVNMRKRIKNGKSANNFSGNYVALFYNLPGTFEDDPRAGLKFGFQRRFLNHGFMDFSFAVFKSVADYSYGFVPDGLQFSTQASFGFAIGDWKKSATAPFCDVLLCDEFQGQQWKIRLPELTVGYYLNRIRTGAAFERKIRTSPWTINVQLDAAMNNGFNYLRYDHKILYSQYPDRIFKYALVYSREKIVIFSVQPRYYFLQKRQRLNGKGGNGLSGWYAGLHTEFNYYKGKHSEIEGKDLKSETNIIQTGPLLGFQLRVFRRGYLDLNTSYNFKDQLKSRDTSFGLRTNIGVGLAL